MLYIYYIMLIHMYYKFSLYYYKMYLTLDVRLMQKISMFKLVLQLVLVINNELAVMGFVACVSALSPGRSVGL